MTPVTPVTTKPRLTRKSLSVLFVLTLILLFTAPLPAQASTVTLTVEKAAGSPLEGVRCYAFTEAGSYLGLNDTTNESGQVSFELSDGSYKIRVDFMGSQYWSEPFTVPDTLSASLTIPHQDVTVTVSQAYGTTSDPGEGIRVCLFTGAGAYQGQNLTTDAGGQVTFNVPEQPFKVRADCQGQQYWSDPFTWQDASVTIPMADAQVTVSGAGGAVEGARVYAFTASGSYLGLNDTTDSSGQVTFRLAAGTCMFRADYDGSQYWSDEAALPADQVTPVAVSLGGGTMTLTVEKAAGSPMEGVRCYAFTEAGSYLGLNDTTNESGQVSFELSDGSYKIRVDFMGSQYWSEPFTVPDTLSASLTIPHQDVTVTVSQTYGTSSDPGEGIRVYLFTEAGAYQGQNLTTDAGGQVTFNVPEQPFKVRADYQGQQYWSDPFAWQDALVAIPMADAQVTVSGAGGALEGARVYAFTALGSYLGLNDTTDTNGQVTFRLAAGTCMFRADYDGSQYWSDEAALPADQVTPVAVSLGGGTVTLTVEKAAGIPLEGVRCYAFTEAGSYLGLNDTTNESGQVSFDLSDGSYRIRVDFMGSQYWSEPFTVPETLSAALTIPHQDVTVTVSRIYGTSSDPGEGIRVYLFTDAGAYQGQNELTDAGGQVTFNVPEQPFKVRADYQGQQYWSDPFAWQDALVAIPMADAQVTVSGAGGALEGARVYAFTALGSYLGLNDTTDESGQVTFRLAAGACKFRADYGGSQYWSDEAALPADQVTPVAVSLGGGTMTLTVEKAAGSPLEGVRCYAFTEAGSYLGLNDTTNESGQVSFDLSDGSYKIRVDFMGSQYWSEPFTVPETLSAALTIPHQDVTVTVSQTYGTSSDPGEGIRVYLFTEAGAYQGQSLTTDAGGQVTFKVPEQPFKVRADYQGQQYWSDPFTWQDALVAIPMADALVTVSGAGGAVEGARVYAFSASGSYLGLNDTTDESGQVTFRLAAGTCMFRADYDGSQYWSDEAALPADQVTPVAITVVNETTVAFSANPETIQTGESSTLSWTTENAESAIIAPDVGEVPVNGSTTVSPAETTTYTITVTGPGGTVTEEATVTVTAAQPTVTLTAAPETILGGGTATLTWESTHADTATISPGIGEVEVNGWITVAPAETTTYTITVTGAGGTATASATVTVSAPEPTVYISASPLTIWPGEGTVLSWTSEHADTATIDPDIGEVEVSGSVTAYPTETTAYTITVTGTGGSAQDAVQVTVAAPPEDMDHGLLHDEQEGGGGLVGETVRILNGNVLDMRTDVTMPSPNGLGLGFHAFYNSRSGDSSDLGAGWSHTYSAFLDPSFSMGGWTLMRILDATGRGHYFRETATGIYTGLFHERTRVVEESGGYVWYRLDGTRLCFDGSGKLLWMEDEKENRLTLSYDANGDIESVTDEASGRALGFVHNADHTLNRITGPVTTAVPGGVWASFTYSGENLGSVTYADGSGFTYTYTDSWDAHNITEKDNQAGHLLNTWAYDSEDRATANYSVEGRGASLVYASDALVHVTDAYGIQRSYTLTSVDGRRRVASISGIAGMPYTGESAMRWVYDEALNLVEKEDANDAVTRYLDHDARGNPCRVIHAYGTANEKTVLYTYHPSMAVPLTRTEASVLGAGFKVTTWDYDADGNSTPNESPGSLLYRIVEEGATTNESGDVVAFEYVTAFSYNTWGQVVSVDGPRPGTGDSTAFTYDPASGDLVDIVRPLIGSTTLTAYDNAGRPGWVTDVNGQSRSFAYDGRGRVTAITNASDGSSTAISYNVAGRPSSVTDEDGITRTFTYDAATGRLTRITDPEDNYIQYGYDAQGNRTRLSKHAPDDTRTYLQEWDYQHPYMPGKLWKEIQASGAFTEYGYDVSGRVSLVTDPEEHDTAYGYDLFDRLASVTQPGDAITAYAYDGQGNLGLVTDAEGNETTYHYDDLGRVVQTDSPDAGTISYAYDQAGNLISRTDALGNTVTYTYDDLNRLVEELYPDPNQNVTYTYDQGAFGMGRRTGMTDESGSLALAYDARGRLTTRTSTVLGTPFTFSQSYTSGGRVESVTTPSGRTLTYTRDAMGRMQGLSTTLNSTTRTLVANMTYNPFAGPKGMSTGAGGEVDNQSGECGCIEVANPGEQMEMAYTYDGNRNLLSVTAPNAPWLDQSFTYDALNRLTHAEGRYGEADYTYDQVGNRLTRTVNGQAEAYTYVADSNRIDEITGDAPLSFTLDAAGNVTAMGDRTLVYNQHHRLVRVEEGTEVLGEYTYNGLGQRVVKEVDGQSTIFLYDMNGKLVAEADATGTITTEYLYMGKIRMAKADVATGNLFFYLNDRLGTPQMMTDETNTVVWEAMYKPFGEATINPNSTVTNNLRFPGQYEDEETGLHYNYHRYYDPRTGRYLRPDPVGQVGGINLYYYVDNNPIENIDPEGLFAPAVIVAPAIYVGVPLLLGAAYYTSLPHDQQEATAKKFQELWDLLWGESDINVCEMRDEPPHWDPGNVGPLKDAYGVGKSLPSGDPGKDKDYWKKPKDWDKKSFLGKAKWYAGKTMGLFGWGSGAGA